MAWRSNTLAGSAAGHAAVTTDFATQVANPLLRDVSIEIAKYSRSGLDDLFTLQLADAANAQVLFFSLINQDIIRQQFGKDFTALQANGSPHTDPG